MWEGDVIMKDLRLVFENDNGEKEDIVTRRKMDC